MPPALQFFVLTFAGWVNRHQDDRIEYLREENRVLRERLDPGPLRLTDAQRRRLAVRGHKLPAAGRRVDGAAGNLTDPVDGCLRSARYWLHDRGPLYTWVFGEILESAGVQPIRLPPKSPNLNAYAERFVRSIKEECLTRVVPLVRGMCVSSTSTSNITIARETTRDSTTSSCNDRHLSEDWTLTFGGGRASADYSISTIERPHEWWPIKCTLRDSIARLTNGTLRGSRFYAVRRLNEMVRRELVATARRWSALVEGITLPPSIRAM